MAGTRQRTHRLMVLISEEMRDKLDAMTGELGISMSSYVAYVIGQQVVMHEKVTRPMMTAMAAQAPSMLLQWLSMQQALISQSIDPKA